MSCEANKSDPAFSEYNIYKDKYSKYRKGCDYYLNPYPKKPIKPKRITKCTTLKNKRDIGLKKGTKKFYQNKIINLQKTNVESYTKKICEDLICNLNKLKIELQQ